MRDDAELLRCYAESRAEDAFAELVRRHVNLVYSCALRQVNGDAHLAQDVAQTVFTDLARKAVALAGHRVLAGWLFTSTRFAAAKLVRGERRRQTREQEAHTMNEILHDSAEKLDWERVRPVIDEALGELGEADREAVLLRFFEGRDFASVGAKLSLAENAARMRVERALDKLHASLARRGVTSTTGALAVALATQAVAAAPLGCAATVTGAALAGATAGVGAGAWVTFMTMTKLQIGIAGAIAVAAATGIAMQGKTNASLREEIAGLHQPADIDALRMENERLARVANEVAALRRDDAELARVSEEAAALKVQLQAQAARTVAPAKKAAATAVSGEVLPMSKVDRVPTAKFRAMPVYPVELRKAGTEGEATVEFIVDAAGKVRNAQAVKSSDPEFGTAAVEALSKWQFDAGQKGGRAVNTIMTMQIVFAGAKEEGSAGTPVPKSESKPVAADSWF